MNIFEREVNKSLQHYQNKGYLIYDSPESFRKKFRKKMLPDFWVFNSKGKYFMLECKSTLLNAFPFVKIPKHQIECLRKVYTWGGRSYFLINFRKFGKVFALSIPEFFNLKENKVKSCSLKYAQKNLHCLDRLKFRERNRKGKLVERIGWKIHSLLKEDYKE